MEGIQYYYAAYNHCEQAAGYYAAKYDKPAQPEAAPEAPDYGED
jgi:hypothetical protein